MFFFKINITKLFFVSIFLINFDLTKTDTEMRNLFESGKLTEVIFFSESRKDVRITMQKNKCFEIRQFNPNLNYWELCYETSSACEYDVASNLAKSLIK